MKKTTKFTIIVILLMIILTSVVYLVKAQITKNNANEELHKIQLNEVTRSVFYAPQYVAISKDFFKEEGLKLEITTGQGADKVMTAILAGQSDIGLCGPEAAIYVYNEGKEDYIEVFAQLTQKDGSFLVGREAEEDFDWSSLKGKEIIGGRPGGIPEMALEYVLKENGLDPENDVNMVTNVDFTATAGAFKSGTGDYVALFEPTATMLENDGGGSIVSSVGEQAGNIAYTCFYTTKSYMDENPEIIQKFTNAIYKGQLWVQQHTSEEIADSISSFFPGTDKDVIVKVIDNYKSIDAFSETPEVSEDGLNKLMDIIQGYDSSLIQTRPDFNVIVNNSFAEEATK